MNSGRCDRCRRRRCPARRRRTWRAPAPCPASPAATGTAEWPAGATASRNPAGANARDARRAGSGCRPGRRPRTSSTIRRRRSACPEQRQQAVRPEAALPARYAGDVHLFVAGAGRRCQRRGRHASRQAQAAACRGAASVEDETSCCCWARWRRWSSSIAARRGTLPSEARCSSIRRRMPARCSSTTRTSSRPANFWSSTTRSRSGSARRRPARW